MTAPFSTDLLTASEVRDAVRRWCDRDTVVGVAEQLGVSREYVHRVMRGDRPPGPRVLDALGLESERIYRRKRKYERDKRKSTSG